MKEKNVQHQKSLTRITKKFPQKMEYNLQLSEFLGWINLPIRIFLDHANAHPLSANTHTYTCCFPFVYGTAVVVGRTIRDCIVHTLSSALQIYVYSALSTHATIENDEEFFFHSFFRCCFLWNFENWIVHNEILSNKIIQ